MAGPKLNHLENERGALEHLERLEQAMSDRVRDDHKNIRGRLYRDHQIATCLQNVQKEADIAKTRIRNANTWRKAEHQHISTGDTLDSFYQEFNELKDHYQRYPTARVENLELTYKKRQAGDVDPLLKFDIDAAFSGEEAYGKFFDLHALHDLYTNVPGIINVKHVPYGVYLDIFDKFLPPDNPLLRGQKISDENIAYLSALVKYLEDFMRRTRPLEDVDKLLETFRREFAESWDKGEVMGWNKKAIAADEEEILAENSDAEIWCADCERAFKPTLYPSHLQGKKHIRNAKAKQNGQTNGANGEAKNPQATKPHTASTYSKYRPTAEKEYMIKRLAGAMQTERADTKANVERKAGLTDKERQQEMEALIQEMEDDPDIAYAGEEEEDGEEEKIYNPLKLPLAWDGKPIPFWLYKLHGLGNEFRCQICGDYVYMGRRAFDKHFTEQRHVYGLKCLGITNTSLFKEITTIEQAKKLHEKLQADKKKERVANEDVVQMEDSRGNVMPEKVYLDLQKQKAL
ncbi:MAG: hypothetical protein M1820_001553 [Bogoriella megaspora]|nr:MAG: hypothetical protein M1820_001553 [Bogoriella megaspora]